MQSNVQIVKIVLKYTFGLVPIVAGLDKFTNILTDWSLYLAPWMTDILPMSGKSFMMLVGVIEVVAGILVFIKTKFGAYLVMAWLLSISFTLIIGGHYFDVAVRDIVMAITAFCLAKLTVADS